jgi:type I restriction enzyme S subunit
LAEQELIVNVLDEADELRKLRAQADRRTAELILALFHEMFGSIITMKPLNELAAVVSGVAKGRKFNGKQPVTVPYMRVANVQAGHLDLTELKTLEALPAEVKELSLKKGDVLLTEGGDFDKLGRGAMLDRDLSNCIHQNHVFRVRCDQSRMIPEYFAGFLLTQAACLYFLRCAKKTSNLASINMTQLRALPVPVPPLRLQNEFAQQVREIRELESAKAQSRARLYALFASLLDKAFKGEL